LVNVGVTGCFYRLSPRVATDAEPWKKLFNIKCFSPLGVCKTPESNMSLYVYDPDGIIVQFDSGLNEG
jgi:hypothetical protein